MKSAARRRLARAAAPAAALLLAVTACSEKNPPEASEKNPPEASEKNPPEATEPSAASATSSGQLEPSASTPPTDTARNTVMDLRVTLDGHHVDATLNGSPAARDFAELLPLTLDFEDFHRTERIADLPRELDTSGAPEPVAAKAGDLAYYAPWGNLALFYREGPPANADLLVLGHLDVDTDRLARADRITIEAAS